MFQQLRFDVKKGHRDYFDNQMSTSAFNGSSSYDIVLGPQ